MIEHIDTINFADSEKNDEGCIILDLWSGKQENSPFMVSANVWASNCLDASKILGSIFFQRDIGTSNY